MFLLVLLTQVFFPYFLGNDLDQMITSVPGTEHITRRRDLASFCRSDDLSNPVIELIVKEAHAVPRAHGLILNTFEELDSLILPHMRKLCPILHHRSATHSSQNSTYSQNNIIARNHIF